MFKAFLLWIICWSLLAFIYYWQSKGTAVFTLLCVSYIPVIAFFAVYFFEIIDRCHKNKKESRKRTPCRNFRVHLLMILAFSFLLILSFSLPEITQDERAIKFMIIYLLASITANIALTSFVDAFNKTPGNKN
jgi:low temperature requirement protein LtrA